MTEDFVTVKGEKYYVEDDNQLNLNAEITDLTEIEGLDRLTNLKRLNIYDNQITEIKGLDTLKNLQELSLRWNQIEEIKGLENLVNLKEIDLWGNPIRVDERHVVYGSRRWEKDVVHVLDEDYLVYGINFYTSHYTIVSKGAQELVRYCQDKKAGRIPFVTVGETRYYAAYDLLNLSGIGLTDISEIKGLEQLTNLKKLYLFGNQITEIKGLDKLTNLQTLHLGGNQITEIKGLEYLTNLKSLYLNDNQIDKIRGLEYLTSLQKLDLDKNPLTTHMGTMKAQELVKYCQEKVDTFPFVIVDGKKNYVVNDTLDLIDLGISEIAEIQGLENFISLQKLYLRKNQIKEIKGLERLTNLSELDLWRNQLSEITGLENLTNLQILHLGCNQIKEIKGLENLTSLQELNLQNNQIYEIKGLEHLTNLKELNLKDNPILSNEWVIAFIKTEHIDGGTVNVTRNAQEIVTYCRDKKEGKIPFVTVRGEKYYVIFEAINLSGIRITDISEIEGLEHLIDLKGLYLDYNNITEIKGLDILTNLQYLSLYDNQIEEIKGLEYLENLREISLWKNPIRVDEWELVGRSAQELVTYCRDKKEGKLPFVTVRGEKYYAENNTLVLCNLGIKAVTKIEGLEKLSNLDILWLSGNQIEEIRGLDHLHKLKELNLSQNLITEINGLDHFPELQRLYLSWNQITEIDGLDHLPLLKKLDLSHNRITEVKGLEHLINLQKLKLGYNPIRTEEHYLFPGSAQELVEYCQEKSSNPDFKPANALTRCYECRRPITRHERAYEVTEHTGTVNVTIGWKCKECYEKW